MQHLYPNSSAPARSARSTLLLALLVALFALLSACGGDDAHDAPEDSQNPTNDHNNAPVDVDAGFYGDASLGEAIDDASATDDASAGDHDPGAPSDDSDYNPDLDEAGAPLPDCRTERVGPDAGAPLSARVFVTSYRQDFDALGSHTSYREHIHAFVRSQVLPCRPDEGASLVVFPEAMSLPMLLIGPKAAAARELHDSERALSAMISAVPDAYAFYGEKYPDSSTNSRFMLAMTDPLVRATYDTFGQLARRYGIYLSVTVTLPDFKRVTQPRRVQRLADPDISAPDYAYEATAPQLYSRQLLFGPDGELVDETLKNYLSPQGREQLGLSDAPLSTLHTFESPWGTSAVTLSDSALMPDVQDRLDDLGARVILQPNALRGGWTSGMLSPPEDTTWQPDRFMLGAYNMVQRSPRAVRSYAAQLTGNFFEIVFDGQVQMVADAAAHPDVAAFVGQAHATPGNLFVGPWVVEDPGVAHPDLTLDERREALRETGERLAPDAVNPLDEGAVSGVWANDLPAPPAEAPSVETHPAISATPERVYLASSQGVVGQRGLRLQVFDPSADASDALADVSVAVPDYDLVRPAIAAQDARVHIVAELIRAGENRLAYIAFDPQTHSFIGAPKMIGTQFVGQRAYHPAIRARGDVLNMTWTQEINGVNRAIFAQTSLGAPFESVSVRTEIARRGAEASARPGSSHSQPPASQWDARLAITSSAIVVTWMNYNAPNWEILAAASVDGGLSWSQAVRVDRVPDAVQALNASPTIEARGGRRFALAWTDARATRPNPRVDAALLTVSSNGTLSLMRPPNLLDEPLQDDAEAISSWRPTIVSDAHNFSVYYETLRGPERSIARAKFGADANQLGTTLVAETAGIGGYFPTVASINGARFLAYEALAPEDIGGSTAHVLRLEDADEGRSDENGAED